MINAEAIKYEASKLLLRLTILCFLMWTFINVILGIKAELFLYLAFIFAVIDLIILGI